jgi:hypothetical protein
MESCVLQYLAFVHTLQLRETVLSHRLALGHCLFAIIEQSTVSMIVFERCLNVV